MTWVCITANGTRLLVFIGDVTADRSRGIISEVHRAILSALIQPNDAKLIGLCFAVQML